MTHDCPVGLVRTLIDCDQEYSEPALPQGLRELYDGELHFRIPPSERPFVIANFVSTLDGVVNYEIKGQAGGSTISGSDPADRFIMGLLRASADATIAGARTVHDVSPNGLWTPEYTFPDAKHLYAEYRVGAVHKSEYPILVIVSGGGKLELERAIFHTPAVRTVVVTTSAGRDELTRRGAATLDSVEIHALNSTSGSIAPPAILQLLHSQFGVETLLHEGGPHCLDNFWRQKL